jgi:ParB-like nuclease domain
MSTVSSFPPLGQRPTLAWLDKRLLKINAAYQRELSQGRSQKLIEKLSASFCWPHASVIVVAKSKKEYLIIDGQHRHAAAMRRDDIKDLPCLLIDAADVKDQVRAFVAHNKDRVALTTLALFHAGLSAGDGVETEVMRAAQAAGVEILTKQYPMHLMEPHQTTAVGAMRQVIAQHGSAVLVAALKALRGANPKTKGQLRARSIRTAADLIGHKLMSAQGVVHVFNGFDGQLLEANSTLMAVTRGCSIGDAAVSVALTAHGASEAEIAGALRKIAARRAEAGKVQATASIGKVNAAKSKNRPFAFARAASRPRIETQAPPSAAEIAAKVRRFEPGGLEVLILRALKTADSKAESVGSNGFKETRFRYRGKVLSWSQALETADRLRLKSNLPPLSTPADSKRRAA